MPGSLRGLCMAVSTGGKQVGGGVRLFRPLAPAPPLFASFTSFYFLDAHTSVPAAACRRARGRPPHQDMGYRMLPAEGLALAPCLLSRRRLAGWPPSQRSYHHQIFSLF